MWSGVESKPLLFDLVEGEARRRGGGTIYATLTRHRSMLGLKVARHWVGLVRPAPHGALVKMQNNSCQDSYFYEQSIIQNKLRLDHT